MNTDERSPKMQVLTDRDGNIRAAVMLAEGRQDENLRQARMVPGEGDVLHEVETPQEMLRSDSALPDLGEYYVAGSGDVAKLVRRADASTRG